MYEFRNIDHDLGFIKDRRHFFLLVSEGEFEEFQKAEKEFFSVLAICLTPKVVEGRDQTEFPEEVIREILEKVGVFNSNMLLLVQKKEYKRDWGDTHAVFHVRKKFDIDLLPREDDAWGREIE